MARIAINGFGRIGRCIVRAALERGDKDLEFVAINDLTDTKTLAHLLKYDSVHGAFDAEVKATEKGIVVNGKEIEVTAEKSPGELPHAANKIDLVLECTGLFTEREKAEHHLKAGAQKVLISAPAKNPDITIAFGINHEKLRHRRSTTSSPTPPAPPTASRPVAKVLLDTFGIKRGLMTTIHSYTNDQNLLDLPHKDLRRARAAALSMIPTTTGAAKAIGRGHPGAQGQARRHRHPRADPERLAGRPHGGAGEAGDRREHQRRHQGGGRRAAEGHPRATPRSRWSRSTTTATRTPSIFDATQHLRHRRQPSRRSSPGTTTSGASPTAWWTWPGTSSASGSPEGAHGRQDQDHRRAATSPGSASSSAWTSTSRWTRRAQVTDDARIRAALPTIQYAVGQKAQGHPRLPPRPAQGQARRPGQALARAGGGAPLRAARRRTSSSPTTASATA